MLSLQIFISNMSGITTTYNFTGQESGLKMVLFLFFKEECITKVHYQVIRFFPFLYLLMASPSSVEDFSFLIAYLHTWNQSWDRDTIKNVCDKRSKKQHSHLQAQSQNKCFNSLMLITALNFHTYAWSGLQRLNIFDYPIGLVNIEIH